VLRFRNETKRNETKERNAHKHLLCLFSVWFWLGLGLRLQAQVPTL
jgi:hypothetical protein